MNYKQLIRLLEDFKENRISQEDALATLKNLPYEDLEFARIDHHREMRKGFPEVIFGAGKTPGQITEIVNAMSRNGSNILITRTDSAVFEILKQKYAEAEFHERSRCITIHARKEITGKGEILVISGGTADIPVAEEAVVTADLFGNRTSALYDAGVAGLNRLLM